MRGAGRAVLWAAAIVAVGASQSCDPVLSDGTEPVHLVGEDDAGWDCERMGNRICGPVAVTLGLDGSADVVARAGLQGVAPAATVTYGGDLSSVVRGIDCEGDTVGGVRVLARGPASVVEGVTRAVVLDSRGCMVARATVWLQ
jgi:hypothetical protein